MPDEAAQILDTSIEPDYNRTNSWQVLVFRKTARTRPQYRWSKRMNLKAQVS